VGAPALRCQQDDLCPPDVFLRAVSVRHHCPKASTLGAGHIDDDPLAHPPDSHAKAEPGILKRDSNVRLDALEHLVRKSKIRDTCESSICFDLSKPLCFCRKSIDALTGNGGF